MEISEVLVKKNLAKGPNAMIFEEYPRIMADLEHSTNGPKYG